MDKKILAFVDGSQYSASVCDYAAWAAGRLGADVELIHVLGRREKATSELSGTIALGARSSLMADLANLDAQQAKLSSHRGRAILEDASARVRGDGHSAPSTQLRNGDIVEAVAERGADARLMVIGKRGEGHEAAQDHLGSNMERLIRATTSPVLVANGTFHPVNKVCLAYDGGTSAIKALKTLAASPIFKDIDVTLVTVGGDAHVLERLNDAQALLADAGINAQHENLTGEPDVALADFVEARGFDMVVMGAYGHSRIRSLIIGSTTTAVIRSCKVPVLLMR